MAIFIGTSGQDTANAAIGFLSSGFMDANDDAAALFFDLIGDFIAGGDGNDFIFAANGDDLIEGGDGFDLLNGAEGNDTIYGNTEPNPDGSLIGDEILGNLGNDSLIGSGGADFLGGGDGLDVLRGGGGNDVIDGGFDVDTMDGGAGIDTHDVRFWSFQYVWNMATGVTNFAGETAVNFENGLFGGGSDSITGTSAANSLDGGDGNDTLIGDNGNDTLVGELGDDLLQGGDADDSISGGDGNDTIEGGFNADTVSGGNGNDLIFAMTLASPGGSGVADVLNGDNGNDTITGSQGGDRLNGGAGIDQLRGGLGDDLYFVNVAGEADETGGGGLDTVRSAGSYTLGADLENLVLLGGGNTNASGNALANRLTGNVGNNTLTGGLDRDVMAGGVGFDRFDFNALAESGVAGVTRDMITDFNAGTNVSTIDQIDVSTIDASAGLAGNQAFVFGGAFTAGHIRAVQAGTNVILEFNTDADAAAEMTLQLNGVFAGNLNAGDFIL